MNAEHPKTQEDNKPETELMCQFCKWWKADDEKDDSNTGGKCRRYPPTVQTGTWGSYMIFIKTTSTHWPKTDAFDYCGEYVQDYLTAPTDGQQ